MPYMWKTAAVAALAVLTATGLHVASGQQNTQPTSDPVVQEDHEPCLVPPDARVGARRHGPPSLDLALPDRDPPEDRPADARPSSEPLWQILSEFYPEQVRQLQALREEDPAAFEQVEHQMRRWLRKLRETHRRDPQLARLMVRQHRTEMRLRDWRNRWQEAKPEDRPALRREGRQLVEQRVDLRLERMQREIAAFEKRLDALRANLQARQANRQAIVDGETAALLGAPASQPAP